MRCYSRKNTMGAVQQLKIGIVGACGRGSSFKAACDALETVKVHAVCDINAEELDAELAKSATVEEPIGGCTE